MLMFWMRRKTNDVVPPVEGPLSTVRATTRATVRGLRIFSRRTASRLNGPLGKAK